MRFYEQEIKIRQQLARARVDNPGLCARILTARAAGLDRIGYILAHNKEFPECARERLTKLADRRSKGEPLAYILGKKEFYGLEFTVSPAVLTPRPETEILVEAALESFPDGAIAFADLGCGSGCIGLTLLKLRPGWRGILLDKSIAALAVAKANANSHDCHVQLTRGDIFCLPFAPASLDLILSNPPYIARSEKKYVMWETLAYEPHSALFSAKNGLAHLEAVIAGARISLKTGGRIILEHGANQKEAVRRMLALAGFDGIRTIPDLAGLARCTMAQNNGEANGRIERLRPCQYRLGPDTGAGSYHVS